MSWASRRRTTYGFGVLLFFVLVIGGPIAYHYLRIVPTCTDGVQNQGESAVDRGGPCPLLDERTLSPLSVLWSRAFRVRDGSYNAVAYIQNANAKAGIGQIAYHFGLYDEQNALVAERSGTTFVMPGAITPVFEGPIDTGERIVAHTYFEIDANPVWARLDDTSHEIDVGNRTVDQSGPLRISAVATNHSILDYTNVTFVITVSDQSGNAFAASRTTLATLPAGASMPIAFSWPDSYAQTIGSVDITPLTPPAAPRGQ